LISADALSTSPAALLVLQAEPSQSEPVALRDLRDGLSDLARSVILQGGAAAVMVIPSLPDPLAESVIAAIWRFAETAPEHYHPAMVINLLDEVRGLVGTAEAGWWSSAERPSDDVALFL
jgi:hypothetical protein